MIAQIDSENADRDLTSQVTVLTHTPSATKAMLCQALIKAGDGTKNLDGTGGDFELEVTVGGNSIQPGPQVLTVGASDTRAAFVSTAFPVPANEEVVIKLLSPNAADTDVDVTAYLYDVLPLNIASGVVEANAIQIEGGDATDALGVAQTGDAYARIGAAGASLTALGDARLANLDAAVSTRLATTSYTAPDNAGIGAVKAQTDKLGTAMEQDGAVYRFTANALEMAPTGGAGEGAVEFTYTLTDSVTGHPIDDALVEIFTDQTTTNKVAQRRTDAFGKAVFHLDAGTYYLVASKSGYMFDNPQTITVAP